MRGPDQAGEDAQDRRFAAAGRTQQRDDLVRLNGQRDVVEHLQRLAVGQRKLVRNAAGLAQHVAACSMTVVDTSRNSSGRRVQFLTCSSEYRRSASSYSRRQTVRLKTTTMVDMTRTLAASSGKLPCFGGLADHGAQPMSLKRFASEVRQYSATMLAFQAPPAAVTQPVTRYGNTAGKYNVRNRCQRLNR